jgi:predicted house-cleaning noncanonical NTP pyrophosphatase (MazG superfamily)
MKPKLVRGLIPSLIIQNEKIPQTHLANNNEFWARLKEKLNEEVNEFLESEEIIELADILEVIDAIVAFKNISHKELIKLKKSKALTHGTFHERVILTLIKDK